MYEGKEYLMPDAEVVKTSVGGNVANVNNSTSQTFITFRRGLCFQTFCGIFKEML